MLMIFIAKFFNVTFQKCSESVKDIFMKVCLLYININIYIYYIHIYVLEMSQNVTV